MNDKLTTSTKRKNRLRFYWEIVTHFGKLGKKILFSFENDTGNRSRFHREKNHSSGLCNNQNYAPQYRGQFNALLPKAVRPGQLCIELSTAPRGSFDFTKQA